MDQESTIIFYTIDKCGYYTFKDSSHYYGNINLFLQQLKTWSGSRNTKDTKLFEPTQGAHQHPLYLADLASNDDNDWIVILWNEIPISDGNVMSLPGTQKVGKATLNLSSVGPDDIPGFPTFYWFISKLNLIATINMDHSFGGKAGMNKYLLDFIHYHTPYAQYVTNKDPLKKDVVAYKIPPSTDLLRLRAALKISPARTLSNHEKIINAANDIVRVTTKAQLKSTEKETKELWQSLASFFDINKYKIPAKENLKFESHFEINLTQATVREIIQEWEDDGGIDSGRDYGFEFTKNIGKKFWLGESFVKDKFTLNLPVKNISDLKASHILEALDSQKKKILQIVPEKLKNKEFQPKLKIAK